MDYGKFGLRKEEYERAQEALGREPNECELRILGVMWSEHCSYKSTKHLLKHFPTKGDAVVLGPGENAGVVNLGGGLGAAFKAESHNHPSAVDPYNGSATGIGGCLRDIFALGARPAATMAGFFFGDPDHRDTARLSSGITQGASDYGRGVEVPTVGGKTVYDKCYNENPLVNAFALGLVDLDKIVSSKTARPGQLVVILGAKTGREGIAGAAFASVDLTEDSKESRPAPQVGDPFLEKRLIEACLELNDRNLIVSMQDMGAAGITSSSSEVAAKSAVGMRLNFEHVPVKEEGMTPWEIALSETQERMLLIVAPEHWEEVLAAAQKWDVDCAVIGETTEGDDYSISWEGKLEASMPATLIGDGWPPIHWPSREPSKLEKSWEFDLDDLPLPENWEEAIVSMFTLPSLAPKDKIFNSMDAAVGGRTLVGPGNPVSVMRLDGRDELIAMVLDADPWKCALDPFRGGAETVAGTVRALAVAGAKPLGLTDCLNFPSPEVEEQYWALEECIKGMAEASKALECPVVSGNVSLYNETPAGAIMPTPVVGTVGLVPSEDGFLPAGAWREGDALFLVGPFNSALQGGHYLRSLGLSPAGRPLSFSPEGEKDFMERALATAAKKCAHSGRAIAGGGLAAALVKEGAESGLGAAINITVPTRKDVVLFGEGGARALYSVPLGMVPLFKALWRGYPCMELGRVGGENLSVTGVFSLAVTALQGIWRNR